MSRSEAINFVPADQREAIIREIGEPDDVLHPSLMELFVGMFIGCLLFAAGAVQFGYWIQQFNKLWCLIGLAMMLAAAGIVYLCYRVMRNTSRLLIAANGFAISSQKKLETCRWDQIAEVKTDEVEYQEEVMPFFKGPLGKIKSTRVDRTLCVVQQDGKEHILAPGEYKNRKKFRSRLDEETKSRNIPWHYQHQVLE